MAQLASIAPHPHVMYSLSAFLPSPVLPVRARVRRICRRRSPRADAVPERRAGASAPLESGLPHPAVLDGGEVGANGLPGELDAAREADNVQTSGKSVEELARLVTSPGLHEYAERMEAGLITPFVPSPTSEWSDEWALAVQPKKARELSNQYSRVGVLIENNFADFVAVDEDEFNEASIEDISRAKARAVYEYTGIPSIAEMHDLAIDPPPSGSSINKTYQQGYYSRNVEEDGDAMIDRVRPISDENRVTRFRSVVAYYDGEVEIVTHGAANVAMAFSAARYVTIAVSCALDELYKILTRRLRLTLYNPGPQSTAAGEADESDRRVLVGATMLRERLMREGKMLNDGIVKVSSFLNHMVDVELMEECGIELAERLRTTMPNKILTVESTGLIPGLPTARTLGIPLVFARKSRPITISDSYQTTYRSATKGVTSELVVSCEYLQAGDRVLIIDDFLAGGSTAEALFRLARMAHAKVVGVGVLIEKMSVGGRAFLSGYDVPVESLAKIETCKADSSTGSKARIVVVEEEPWVSPEARAQERERARRQVLESEARRYVRQGPRDGARGEDDVSGEGSFAAEDDLGEEDFSVELDDDDDGVIDLDDDDDFDMVQDSLIRSAGR